MDRAFFFLNLTKYSIFLFYLHCADTHMNINDSFPSPRRQQA